MAPELTFKLVYDVSGANEGIGRAWHVYDEHEQYVGEIRQSYIAPEGWVFVGHNGWEFTEHQTFQVWAFLRSLDNESKTEEE